MDPGWRRYLLWEPERETHTRRRKPTLTCVWDVEGLKDTICRCVFSHRLKTVAGDVPYNQFTLYSSFTVVLPHNTCQVNITQHILLHRRMKIQDDTHQVGDSKIPSSCSWEGKSGSSQHKQGWQEAKHHFCICLFTVFTGFEPSVFDKIRNKQWKTTEINPPDALFTWQAGDC